ncbi:MAG TPA: RNA 3'-terminal phosphate cyclase [Fimbriimonas sp.]
MPRLSCCWNVPLASSLKRRVDGLVRVEGSYGEGGGQILRSCAALSAVTGRPVEIVNVRGKRTRPGFQPQHLRAVLATAELCGARLKGAEVGSTYLLFEPTHEPKPGDYRFDIGTAGATTLVVQAVLVPLLLTRQESRIVVTGGTHNDHAPCAEYLEFVLLPALERAGVAYRFEYPAAGYYPRGGGRIELQIQAPTGLRGLVFAPSVRPRPCAVSLSSSLPPHVAQRGADALRHVDPNPEIREKPSPGAGAAAFTYLHGLAGFTGLGAKGKPMEAVARDAAEPMEHFLEQDAAIDEHLADQLVLPMSFACGPTRYNTWQATEHLRTVAWVAAQFLDVRIRIDEDETGRAFVEIDP